MISLGWLILHVLRGGNTNVLTIPKSLSLSVKKSVLLLME